MKAVKKDWKLPTPPEGFDVPVACYSPGGLVEFDWTREPERDFASEEGMEPRIEWPFVEGVEHVKDGRPDLGLWEKVGILPVW